MSGPDLRGGDSRARREVLSRKSFVYSELQEMPRSRASPLIRPRALRDADM